VVGRVLRVMVFLMEIGELKTNKTTKRQDKDFWVVVAVKAGKAGRSLGLAAGLTSYMICS
jgi:hypothetical protein